MFKNLLKRKIGILIPILLIGAVFGTLGLGYSFEDYDGYFSSTINEYADRCTIDNYLSYIGGEYERPSSEELVACWNFDEGNGIIALDSTLFENHGTIYGANWVNGISGYALKFNGQSDYLRVPDADSLDIPTNNITITAWINADSFFGEGIHSGNPIVCKWQSGKIGQYHLTVYSGGNLRFRIADGSRVQNITAEEAVSVNEWCFVTATWDGSTMKLYVNGELASEESTNISSLYQQEYTEDCLMIGYDAGGDYPYWFFDGTIDEVRIYDKALDEYEISNIYNEINNGNLSFDWSFPSSNENFEIEMYKPYDISLNVINNGPNHHNFTFGLNYSLSQYYNIFGMEIDPYWETNENSICYFDGNYYKFGTYINSSINPYQTKKHIFRIISNWNWLPEEHIGEIYTDILLQGLSQLSTIKEGIEFLEVITQLLFESAPAAEYCCNVIGDFESQYNESIKIWTSEEKNTALACSMFNSVLADFDTILGVSAIPITFGASALAFIAEGAIMASSQDLYLKASDPDSNFTVFENPCPPYFPAIENLSGLYKDIAHLCIHQPCYSNLFTKSYAKYLGALEKNSTYWAGIQLVLTKYFVKQYANISKIIYGSLETMFPEFPPLTSENITEIRNYLSMNGLPEVEKNLLKYHGFSDDTIDIILQRLLIMDDEYYFEAVDGFPQKYKNFSLVVDNLVNSSPEPPEGLLIASLEIENDFIDKIEPPAEINCYLEFQNISNLSGYQITSITLLNQIQPIYISQIPGDYDNDGFQDFLIRFNISELFPLIEEGNNLFIITGNITNPLSETFNLAGASVIVFNGESPNIPAITSDPIFVRPNINLTVTTSSFDPENSGIYYRFDWGDDNISRWFGPYKSEENCTLNYSWIYSGEYSIRAQAMDVWAHKSGWSDALSVIVNTPPTADINGPYKCPEASLITFDATGSWDPDGDFLTFSWDLDDDGQFDDATGPTPSYVWCDDYSGIVSVEVSDGVYVDTDSTTVNVYNVAPIVDAGPDITILTTHAIERIGVITDSGCDTWDIKIDYGDGSPSVTYLNYPARKFDIYHEYHSLGDYIVQVDVKDDDGGYGSDTFLVHVICLPEVWVDDDWFCQVDVDWYDPSLTWQWDAWNSIQDGVDVVCEGGIVHVLNGMYEELSDILLYKEGVLVTGVNQPPFYVSYRTAAMIYTPMVVTADGVCIEQFAFMPEPGIPSVTIDVDGDVSRADNVKVNHNKFMRGCEDDAVAIENKNMFTVDACFNWWGAMDGPSGDVIDPYTGRVAEGFGASIVNNGPIHFYPWAGLDACGTIRLNGRLMIYDGSCSFAYHLDGTENANIEYLWNFGDKQYSNKRLGAHYYANPGIYTITLRIKAIDSELASGYMYDWEYFRILIR